ncbi:MAG: acyl-CoA dehydrogenase family protein [Pseudomonadota bacterium]
MHALANNEILTSAEAAADEIAQHADWAEDSGRLHDDVVSLLKRIGVSRLYLPTKLGGLAVSPAQCAAVCETLAESDSAAAWFVMVFNAARLMAASWPEATVEHLWADDPDLLLAASGHTPLTAVASGSGYVLNGQNSFVSGAHHAEYMMGPAVVPGRDGEMFMAIAPMASCEIVPNWDTLGMRGTGSNDVRVNEVHVPAEFVINMSESRGPNSYYQDDLYRCPARVVFATYVPIVLKMAEMALAELSALAQLKVPYATDKKLAHKYLAQQHYGQGLALWRSAHTYFFTALEQVYEQAQRGHKFDTQDRADLYLAGTHALQASAQAVKHVMDAAGSSSLRKGSKLERIHRDTETLRHHGFANESRYASVTQAKWGVDLDYPLLLR